MEENVQFSIALYGGLLWLLIATLCGLIVWASHPLKGGFPRKALGRCALLLATLNLPAAAVFSPILLVLQIGVLGTVGLVLLLGGGRWVMILFVVAVGTSLCRDLYVILGLINAPEILVRLALQLSFSAKASLGTVTHLFFGILIDGAVLLMAARIVLAAGGLTVAVKARKKLGLTICLGLVVSVPATAKESVLQKDILIENTRCLFANGTSVTIKP